MSAVFKKIWITGGQGFIGQRAAAEFRALGHAVFGLGHGAWRATEPAAISQTDWLNGEIAHANLDALANAHGAPDLVFHLAGGSAVAPSFSLPAEDFRRTVTSAADLAEWVRLRAPSARVVMASSAAVYGADHSGLIDESAVCRPFSPYGFHKRMAELVFESYARNFGLSVGIVRFFSVYGPGLRKQLLWDCCGRLARQPRALELGGHGTELRDWLHVDDGVRLMLRIGDVASPACPVFNGGTGVATPIRDVAATLCWAWQMPDLALRFSGAARAGDPASLVADPAAAIALGWQPLVDWREGLASYIAWFKAHGQRGSP